MKRKFVSLRTKMLTFILPALLFALIGFSAKEYFNTNNIYLSEFQNEQKNAESHIVESIELIDSGYRMLEKEIEPKLTRQMQQFLKVYQDAGSNPRNLDLKKLKAELEGKPEVYIINADSIIEFTSEDNSVNFDFKKFGLGENINKVRAGNNIVFERIRTNTITGSLGDWCYMPTPDHKYVLELGYNSTEMNSSVKEMDIVRIADEITKKSPFIKSIKVYDTLGMQFGNADVNNNTPSQELLDRIGKTIENNTLEIKNSSDSVDKYIYINLDSKKEAFANNNKIIEISYDLSGINSKLRESSMINIVISVVAILFFIVLVVNISNWLTIPISKLRNISYEISKGNYSVSSEIKTNDEIGELAKVFNGMAKQIEKNFSEIAEQKSSLEYMNKNLEEIVSNRTRELNETNTQLMDANEELVALNEELQDANKRIIQTQDQLVESEKMVALGHLIAGIAHEINTPLGAIQTSGGNMSVFIQDAIKRLQSDYDDFSDQDREEFYLLFNRACNVNDEVISLKEERSIRRKIIKYLEENEVEDADIFGNKLVIMGIYDDYENFLRLFKSENGMKVLELAYNLSALLRNTRTIKYASDRASKVVFALKSYAHFDNSGETVSINIKDSIENVLTLYHNKIKTGIELVKQYEDIPPVNCFPDELSQVWSNLIYNALQAMEYKGKLEIRVYRDDNNVIVSITDSGKGVPEEIKEKIFDPFFTTKSQGEGSGLGLNIVKKIINKHKGKIEVESEPGNTTFKVYISYDIQKSL